MASGLPAHAAPTVPFSLAHLNALEASLNGQQPCCPAKKFAASTSAHVRVPHRGCAPTIPDKTLLAFADPGSADELMAADGGDAEEVIVKFAKAGVEYDKLASDLQREAAESFAKDWNEMLASIASKSTAFNAAV